MTTHCDPKGQDRCFVNTINMDPSVSDFPTNGTTFGDLMWIDKLQYQLPIYLSKIPINEEIKTLLMILTIANGSIIMGSMYQKPRIIMSINDVIEINMDLIKTGQSIVTPIIGAIVLVGLYYSINKDAIYYLNGYIFLTSFVSNYSSVSYVFLLLDDKLGMFRRYRMSVLKSDLPQGLLQEIDYSIIDKDNQKNFKNYLLNNDFDIIDVDDVSKEDQIVNYIFDLKFLVCGPISLTINYLFYYYSFTREQENWILSNITLINFIIFSLNKLKLSNFKVSFIFLIGLFLYDIYFVFGTEIMVKVATSVKLPIKILIPKLNDLADYKDMKFSLLGLGDIIVPGNFIALCRSFDRSGHKHYFITSLVFYTLGLIESFLALYVFNVGQPALLYIVPNLLISILVVSWYKGELKHLFNFTEEIEEYDSKKEYQDIDEAGHEDPDYELDSYDEWEFKVEHLRDDENTDIDDEEVNQIIYEFGDDDDDDDTFVIDKSEDEEEEEEEEEEDDENGQIDGIGDDEDLDTLLRDNKKKVSYWYDD